MLQQESVEAATLELIKLLQSREYLKDFHLVGGTALALYLDHRKSVDIDLFSNSSFDTGSLLENIQQDFPFQLSFTANNTLKGSIDNTKVDILAHRYLYLQDPVKLSGISAISMPDIAAMKLNAISISGQRSKDFIDIYYLSGHFDLGQMISFYKTKYNQPNETFILKSLIYFDEADMEDWPVLVKNPDLKWEVVKQHLEKLVLNYIKIKK